MPETYENFRFENYVPVNASGRMTLTIYASQMTLDQAHAAIAAFQDDVDAMYGSLSQCSDRFVMDVTAAMRTEGGQPLAVIDYVNNTYTANEKADDIFREAAGIPRPAEEGVTIFDQAEAANVTVSESRMHDIAQNMKRIFDNIFTTDDETALVYDQTASPIDPYDDKALDTMEQVFLLEAPNAIGNARAWMAYALVESDYISDKEIFWSTDNSRWELAPMVAGVPSRYRGESTHWCENIDTTPLVWNEIEDSSSSSSSSSPEAENEG